jgi:sugar (pentulose or hexulose) kinase
MPIALLDLGTTKLAAGFGDGDRVREIFRVPLPSVVFEGPRALQSIEAIAELLNGAIHRLGCEQPPERWDALVLVGQRGTGVGANGRMRSWLDRGEAGLAPQSLVCWAAEKLTGVRVDTPQTAQCVDVSVPRRPAGSIVGQLASGVPLVLGGGDKNAEHWGAGVFGDDVAALSLGTAFSLGVVSRSLPPAGTFGTPSAREGFWHIEVGIPWGGALFPWADRLFGPPGAIEPDSPYFLPYVRGSLDEPSAEAAWRGLHRCAEPGEFAASVREGVAFELRRLRDRLPVAFRRVRVSGGADADVHACQAIADALEAPLERLDERAANATLWGAYSIGRFALGRPWEPALGVLHTFAPRPFAGERYRRWLDVR